MKSAVSQNRHILSMMGITLWADKTNATFCHLPSISDRLMSGRTDVPEIHQDTPASLDDVITHHDDLSHHLDGNHQHQEFNVPDTSPLVIDDLPDEVNHHHTSTIINPPQAIATFALSISYHIKGVRFGRWILIMDMQHIDTDAHDVWLNLCQKLHDHAKHNQTVYRTHEIKYPFSDDDYLEHQHLNPANDALKGFVLGLTLPDFHTHIGLLTPLTSGLVIDDAKNLIDIRLLVTHHEQKKALWTLITT